MGNTLGSEDFAVLATIDPDAYGQGAQNSDWVDMAKFDQIMAIVMVGTMGTTALVDFKLQQATTSGGAGAKDITGKAITQLTQASPDDSDKQAIVCVRADELDLDNNFAFVRAVMTIGDTASPPVASVDSGAVLLAFGARYGPAYDNDLASVAEIVN